jgi:hypothetical protein
MEKVVFFLVGYESPARPGIAGRGPRPASVRPTQTDHDEVAATSVTLSLPSSCSVVAVTL